MATVDAAGTQFTFAPNPFIQGEIWSREFPPIEFDGPYLRNKFTGELVPNTPEFAIRSDILEPYIETQKPKKEKVEKVEATSTVSDLETL